MIVVSDYRPNLADRCFHKIGKVAADGDIDLLEFQCAAIALVWGLCIANPFVSTEDFNRTHAFLINIAPKRFWGLLMLVGALVQFVGYRINSIPIRKYGVSVKIVVWSFLGCASVVNVPERPMTWFDFIFAATSFAVLLRLNRFNARV